MSSAVPRPLTTEQIYTYYKAFRLAMYDLDFDTFYDGIREIDFAWLNIATKTAKTAPAPAGNSTKSSAPIPKYKRPK